MKRVLVTGASGFVGRFLCRELERRGFRVTRAAHRNPASAGRAARRVDLTQPRAVSELVRRARPDYVCHLAASSLPRLSWQRQADTFLTNTGGTLHLLEAVRRHAPEAKILYVSSNQVYGRTLRRGRVRETALAWPENPYAASKFAAEAACRQYEAAFGLRVVLCRPFNHTGPGQKPELVFSDWCRQIAALERSARSGAVRAGDMDVKRDFLHVEDVVRAYALLLVRGEAGRLYNVCSGRAVRLAEYARFLARRARVRVRFETRREKIRPFETPVACGDPGRLRALGWRPQKTAFDALGELLEDWRAKIR